jgi:hypothetical protein
MKARAPETRGEFLPVIAAATVAVLSTAALFLLEFHSTTLCSRHRSRHIRRRYPRRRNGTADQPQHGPPHALRGIALM